MLRILLTCKNWLRLTTLFGKKLKISKWSNATVQTNVLKNVFVAPNPSKYASITARSSSRQINITNNNWSLRASPLTKWNTWTNSSDQISSCWALQIMPQEITICSTLFPKNPSLKKDNSLLNRKFKIMILICVSKWK